MRFVGTDDDSLRISEWLDTETRAILCEGHDKAVLTATDGYSLLLLTKGADEGRFDAVMADVAKHGFPNSTPFPFVIRHGMTLEKALLAQFAFACCDCAAAFVRDEFATGASAADFTALCSELRASPEFQFTDVDVEFLPSSDAGKWFSWMFLGMAVGIAVPMKTAVIRKKARLMMHWGEKIGGIVRMVDGGY
jgi:hypothetical protein